MTGIDVEIRSVPAQRVATISRDAPGLGSEHIGPVVGPMFSEVLECLDAGGVEYGHAVAVYTFDDPVVHITAGYVLEDDASAVDGVDVHVLPAIERAAIAVHAGTMATIDRSWRALMDAAAERGETLQPACRELYLTRGDVPQEEWVTELVQPLGDGPAADR